MFDYQSDRRCAKAKKTRREIPEFPDDVVADCERLEGLLADCWASYLREGKNVESYRRNYAAL